MRFLSRKRKLAGRVGFEPTICGSSVVLHAVGIPPELFTCTFACARTVGWTAHIVEQLQDNRLFRPDAEYVGPEGLTLEVTPPGTSA